MRIICSYLRETADGGLGQQGNNAGGGDGDGGDPPRVDGEDLGWRARRQLGGNRSASAQSTQPIEWGRRPGRKTTATGKFCNRIVFLFLVVWIR
jgi:hypothetical protein